MARADLPELGATERTTIRREPERASTDGAAAYAVLDEGLVAHVGIVADGQPYVLPMAYARVDDRLILHGSVASRLSRGLASGWPACVTVTLLDGLVLARSAFNHSMNYRSVVILGTARRITDPAELSLALDALVEHVAPGRTAEVRPANDREVRQTIVVELDITEASLKVRTGDPVDEPEDLTSAAWAGVLPLPVVPQPPIPSGDLAPGIAVAPSVAAWRR